MRQSMRQLHSDGCRHEARIDVIVVPGDEGLSTLKASQPTGTPFGADEYTLITDASAWLAVGLATTMATATSGPTTSAAAVRQILVARTLIGFRPILGG